MTRDIRDRLAEALWRLEGNFPPHVELLWPDDATLDAETGLPRVADRLLQIFALPSVGLTINTLPDEEGS